MSQAMRLNTYRDLTNRTVEPPGFASTAQPNSSRQKAAARLKANVVNLKTAAVVFRFLALLSAGTASAADLHPIIAIETGYFFGGSENGRWIKAVAATKSTGKKTALPGLQANEPGRPNHAGKPKSVDERCP